MTQQLKTLRLPALSAFGQTDFRRTLSLTLVCAIIMMIPALLNGRPFHFVDFNQYFSIGEIITERVIGAPEDSAPLPQAGSLPSAGEAAPDQAEPSPQATDTDGYFSTIAGGRSPFYALIAYLLSAKLSMWLLCLMQTGIAAWLIIRFLDFTVGERRPYLVLGGVAGLTFFTALGFHANLTMPDIYAAFLSISAILLIFRTEMSRLETLALTALICVSALMHTTILLLGLLFLALSVAYLIPAWSRRHVRRLAPACLLGAVFLSIAVQSVYGFAAEKLTGEPLRSPPYLTARVMDDGPGKLHLEAACARDPDAYALCAFAGVDYENHNEFIWGAGQTGKPSFIDSPADLKRALLEEQRRFVLDSISAYPLQQIGASLENMVAQFFDVSIQEIDEGAVHILHNYLGDSPQALAYTPGFRPCLQLPDSCTEANLFNTAWNGLVYTADLAALVGFMVILGAWSWYRVSPSGAGLAGQDHFLLMAWTIFLLLLANAFVCGVASGVHDRYQARLIWIVPLCLLGLYRPISQLRDHVLSRQ
ncbi:hypothetical protein [uncultured Hyphomonas sp.]|jgi:hypothetical protein|uniref:hypothetical protein n=1 Tax=uncultured Hyphomonas sp. TaxID=225298 RepID=UPI0030D78215|tara:strand:- start:490 stop:2094 length:1605 start_codon:yes stop_codon:yes gene_type:complete